MKKAEKFYYSSDTSPRKCSVASNSTNSPQDECFKMKKHSERCLHIMEQYLYNQQLTDVVLVAGKTRIPAHRLVLSANCEYFAAMFTNTLRETLQNEIELKEVNGDALWILILYFYTGTIDLMEDNIETLLATASLLQLDYVVKACCQFLIKQLDPSNCLGIRKFADIHGCSNLLKTANTYSNDHFMEVIKHQEFLLLSAEDVATLLQSDDLNVTSEESVFNALLRWLEHDPKNRKQEASNLLTFVKLPLLSPAFLTDHVENNEMFQEQRNTQILIMEALKYHLLPERRPMLQSNRTRPRKATVGQLLAVGGMNVNKCATTIDVFSLRKNTWKTLTNMIGQRLQFGAAVVEKKLVVAGGRDGLKTLNLVECFDFEKKTWSLLPHMATPRHGLGVAVLEGPLYAVGGHDGWSFLNTVERWDPTSHQWTYVSPMCYQRSTVGVAVLNDKLYAVGGRDNSCCLSSVECYDPHSNKWTSCAPMSRRRGGVGVGVMNGCLYALGGHDAPLINPHNIFDCVERYDPKTDTWTTVAPMSSARDTIGVCVLGDKLLAVGGYDGQQYLSLVEAYDPILNEWTQITPLNSGRAGPCVVIKNTFIS
ncbi:PREDICTED: kelch-like protein 5 [Ceratosolen solmsi marchali]|uniref:Kelch-like protein diablo n=1 Tax=Ceratosolen solmsi marchali TaxID=326594 RepID=A0AAJ6YX85_9HYME|nr:PREDICTED: kelch-like protein 5 [Ceratosolen solmsi marchali]